MHELSIAQSLITSVIREKESRGLSRIHSIGMRIGLLSGVLPDALQFGYEAAREGTALESADLVIEEVPVRVRCRMCRQEFEVEDFAIRCPGCLSGEVDVVNGYEIDIVFIEAETGIRHDGEQK